MNEYIIEQQIKTVSGYCVENEEHHIVPFEKNDIIFSEWGYGSKKGYKINDRLVSSIITAENHRTAFSVFRKRLNSISSKITLLSQGYMEHIFEPFLIHKKNSDTAYFYNSREKRDTGLSFSNKHLEALSILMNNKTIPNEFYSYRKDATNATGDSSKILLMCSAIESLAKHLKKGKDKNGEYRDFIKEILGKPLFLDIMGSQENQDNALRNRLVHGEYFNEGDGNIKYVDKIHHKIILYFNQRILNEKILSENITNPQRKLFGSKEGGGQFIENVNGDNTFNLKKILEDVEDNIIASESEHYNSVNIEKRKRIKEDY